MLAAYLCIQVRITTEQLNVIKILRLQMIPTLQYYKYLYALRLIDYGLCNEGLHYLEEVAAHIIKRPGKYGCNAYRI